MTNIEHQPKPNTPDEKSPTVDDILGVKDHDDSNDPNESKKDFGGRAVLIKSPWDDTMSILRFSIPMPKEAAKDIINTANYIGLRVSDLADIALKLTVTKLKKARDWKDREQAYLNEIEPFLIPLPESQKNSASPAELSD